jgi:hypothetical protein
VVRLNEGITRFHLRQEFDLLILALLRGGKQRGEKEKRKKE